MNEESDLLKVTRKDVEDAILLGDIIGGYDETFPNGDSWQDLCCLPVTVKHKHCPSCTCESNEYEWCDHQHDIQRCVMAAIGASPEAEMLWLTTSLTIRDLHPGTRDVDKSEPVFQRWLAPLVRPGRRDHEGLNEDLEAAALLREGLLPPGVIVVAAKQEKNTASKGRRP